MVKWIACRGKRPTTLESGPIEVKHRFGQVKEYGSADDVADWAHCSPPSPSDIVAARSVASPS